MARESPNRTADAYVAMQLNPPRPGIDRPTDYGGIGRWLADVGHDGGSVLYLSVGTSSSEDWSRDSVKKHCVALRYCVLSPLLEVAQRRQPVGLRCG